MWILRITLLSAAITILPAHSTPIQVSKPKAVTSKPDLEMPYIIVKNFKPNNKIVIKVPSQVSLPDPEKGKLRKSTKPLIPDYSRRPPIKTNLSDGYDFYFPQPTDTADDETTYDPKEIFLIEMHPPSESEEPNYYAKEKKTKTKKYNPNKKHVNYKQPKQDIDNTSEESRESKSFASRSDEDVLRLGASESVVNVKRMKLPPAPKVTMKPIDEQALNIGEYVPSGLRRSDDAQQIQFQMHGFNGPKSYRFGYDTGKGKNRHFRIEQRDKDGNVQGEYGFYDDTGKMNLVKYTSKANGGFISELTT